MSTLKYETRSFAAINKDDQVRNNSSSGGIFYELAKYVIELDGVVFGAAFEEDGLVSHKACDSIDSLPELMQSKYVQSNMGVTYKEVEVMLKHGRMVLFSGTPCQVYGLLSYLKISNVCMDNLITVDIICHGVPSRMIWRLYLKEVSQGRHPININFRDKTNGWRDYSLKIDYSDGSRYIRSKNNDPYIQGFIKNLYLRESCYNCCFRGIDRLSDFTIADFWKVNDFLPKMYDNKGTSIVMVHNHKGINILNGLQDNMVISEISNDIIVQTNSPVVTSVKPHPKRDIFFRSFSEDKSIGGQIAVKIQTSLLRRVLRKVKKMLK